MTTQPTTATASTAGKPTPAPTTADPLPYAYSTGNAFAAFAKFNGKNYLRGEGKWRPSSVLLANGMS